MAGNNLIVRDIQHMQLPKLTEVDPVRVKSFADLLVWGVLDQPRFFELVKESLKLVSPGIYFGDNIFTWGKNNSLFEDPVFCKAWEENIKNESDRTIAWRRYILACAGYHCIQLPGDFVECGVYNGTGIKTVIDYLGAKDFEKTFWGYDTFDYHPVESHAFAGQRPGFFEDICNRFAGYNQVKLIKGLIPESFKESCPTKIAYLHIDLNNAPSEIATLDALFDLVVPGGIIILDDYEWAGVYRPQKIAEDKWFEARQYRVFPLPTGQGLVLKR